MVSIAAEKLPVEIILRKVCGYYLVSLYLVKMSLLLVIFYLNALSFFQLFGQLNSVSALTVVNVGWLCCTCLFPLHR